MDKLTVDYRQLLKMRPIDRVKTVNKLGSEILSRLTPSQYAALFPSYYKKMLPDKTMIGAALKSGSTGINQSGFGYMNGQGGTSSGNESGTYQPSDEVDNTQPTYKPSTQKQASIQKQTPKVTQVTPKTNLSKNGSISGGNRPNIPPSNSRTNYAAHIRKDIFNELDNNPKLKDQVMRMMRSENGNSVNGMTSVLESAVNRNLAEKHGSMNTTLHNGFYGPINTNKNSYTKPLSKQEREMAEQAIENVKNGSNRIGWRSDQGLPSDPGSATYRNNPKYWGWNEIDGEHFAYKMERGRKWALDQEKAEQDWNLQNLNPNNKTPLQPTPQKNGQNSASKQYIQNLQKTNSGGAGNTTQVTSENLKYGDARFSAYPGREKVLKGMDPRMVDTLTQASRTLPEGYKLQMHSGNRTTNNNNHNSGHAMDVVIIGPDGKPVFKDSYIGNSATGKQFGNYQNPAAFKTYERLAQAAKEYQSEKYPDMPFRWLGYAGAKGGDKGYGAMDLMHFDNTGKSEGSQGSFKEGRTGFKSYGDFESNVGMSHKDYISPWKELSDYQSKQPQTLSSVQPTQQTSLPQSTAKTDIQNSPYTINDISESAGIGDKYGRFENGVAGLTVHHTSGRGKIEGVVNTFKQRGYPAQYIMDRDGKVYRALPEGARGRHMRKGQGIGEGYGNWNMEGIEVMAKDNSDWTPEQLREMDKFAQWHSQKYGYDPRKTIFGHGEVNPHKEADEGQAWVSSFREKYDKGEWGKEQAQESSIIPQTTVDAPKPLEQRGLTTFAGHDDGIKSPSAELSNSGNAKNGKNELGISANAPSTGDNVLPPIEVNQGTESSNAPKAPQGPSAQPAPAPTPAPAPQAAPKAISSPAPKVSPTPEMASGGTVRGSGEEISMYDKQSNKKLGEIRRGENVRFDHSGKAQVTPDRRIDPRQLETQKEVRQAKIEKSADMKTMEQNVSQNVMQQMKPKTAQNSGFASNEHWGSQPTNPSFMRAMEQTRGRKNSGSFNGSRFGEDQQSNIS